MSQYLIGDEPLVEDLLRAQRPPPRWTVYRVQLFQPHVFSADIDNERYGRCRWCTLQEHVHVFTAQLRVLSLLTNGPIRRLAILTCDAAELERPARHWLHTLYNLAEAANTRIDGWIAYDGRG